MKFNTWKTIKLTNNSSMHEAYFSQLKSILADSASGRLVPLEVLEKIHISKDRLNIELVRVSARDLKITAENEYGKVQYATLLKAALDQGLCICREEIGPALRLRYIEQFRNEDFEIAMQPLEPLSETSFFALTNNAEGLLLEIRNQLITRHDLGLFDDQLYVFEKGRSQFPTWKTVSVGEYVNAKEYHKALLKLNSGTKEYVELEGLRSIKARNSELTVNLVKLKYSDFFLPASTPISVLVTKALAQGFELCEPDVAIVLRLNYLDQPIEENLRIAMEPLACFKTGFAFVFMLRHSSDGLELDMNFNVDTDKEASLESGIVFQVKCKD